MTNEAFDEKQYLQAYPDIAAAVDAGHIASGREHYESYGRAEGRSPTGAGAEVEYELRGIGLPSGAQHYRAYVGPPERYDTYGALQFNLLTNLGLREYHTVLDLGCGSLRVGKMLIPYLLPGRYVGVDPEAWLIDEGIAKELGRSILDVKRPQFCSDPECELDHFGLQFDYGMANSVYSHAPLDWIRRSARRVAGSLSPGGVMVANFFRGSDDYEGDEWGYPAVRPYTLETMRKVFEREGLVYDDHPEFSQADSRGAWFTAQRPK